MAKQKQVIDKIEIERIKPYFPFTAMVIAIILFFNFIFMPQKRTLSDLSSKVKTKKDLFSQAEATAQSIDKLNASIDNLEKEIRELEERLPEQIEANLLIETLKDITKGSKIQFISIEPKKPEKFEMAGQQQVYLELPIMVRLKSGYDELSDFIKKIESSKRLMKVSSLKIRADPSNVWEHSIELTISTFSALKE